MKYTMTKASSDEPTAGAARGETESAVRRSPYTVKGWRPTSVVNQPASTAMQPARLIKLAFPARIQAQEAEAQYQKSDADHDAERPEYNRHRWPVFARHRVEPRERCIKRMLENERRQFWDLDRISDLAGGLIGQAEQHQWRTVRVTLVMAFHRHHLGGLVLLCVEAVLIAGQNLDRHHQRRHPHRHRKHHPRTG